MIRTQKNSFIQLNAADVYSKVNPSQFKATYSQVNMNGLRWNRREERVLEPMSDS